MTAILPVKKQLLWRVSRNGKLICQTEDRSEMVAALVDELAHDIDGLKLVGIDRGQTALSMTHNRLVEFAAEAMLREDQQKVGRKEWEQHNILFQGQLDNAKRKEIQPSGGVVDDSLSNLPINKNRPGTFSGDGQGMYWRQHPEGRKVNTKEQRERHGAGFYRG